MEEKSQANRSRLLFGVALAGVLLYVLLDVAAQSLPPHYSAISQAESDLAVGPYGYIMAINFINRGIFSLCFLFAVLLAANSFDTANPQLRRGAWLFAAWGIGALLLAVFPTDVPATPVSWHGAIHLAVAVVAFLGGAFGTLYISLGMAGNRTLRKARMMAVPLAYLSLALFVVEIFGGAVSPALAFDYGGLIERLFLGSVLLWIGTVSATMVAKPIKPPI